MVMFFKVLAARGAASVHFWGLVLQVNLRPGEEYIHLHRL